MTGATRYRITGKIGEGGMGEVFHGVDQKLNREVAVKVLRLEYARNLGIVERFQAEALTLAQLNHGNIATLYDFESVTDEFFMVMEYVSGETLASLVSRVKKLPVDQAAAILIQVLDAISHAHQFKVIHRDLKPANVMLTKHGIVKVMDFGIAKVLGQSSGMTRDGRVIGTIEYMSPEQIQGEQLDHRSDIYSLGVLFFEMIVGSAPFSDTNEYKIMRAQIEQAPPSPRSFSPNLTEELEAVILKALAKKAEERFQSAEDFRTAIVEALGTVPKLSKSLTESAVSSPLILKETRVSTSNSFSAKSSGGALSSIALPETRIPYTPQGQEYPRNDAVKLSERSSVYASQKKYYILGLTSIVLLGTLLALGYWINRKPPQGAQEVLIPTPSPASQPTNITAAEAQSILESQVPKKGETVTPASLGTELKESDVNTSAANALVLVEDENSKKTLKQREREGANRRRLSDEAEIKKRREEMEKAIQDQ